MILLTRFMPLDFRIRKPVGDEKCQNISTPEHGKNSSKINPVVHYRNVGNIYGALHYKSGM